MGGTAQFLWAGHHSPQSFSVGDSDRQDVPAAGAVVVDSQQGQGCGGVIPLPACDTRRKEKQPTADFGTVRPLQVLG